MFNPKCIHAHYKFKSDKTSLMHFYELSDIHQKELNIHQQNKEYVSISSKLFKDSFLHIMNI